jgi:hypothetical protein
LTLSSGVPGKTSTISSGVKPDSAYWTTVAAARRYPPTVGWPLGFQRQSPHQGNRTSIRFRSLVHFIRFLSHRTATRASDHELFLITSNLILIGSKVELSNMELKCAPRRCGAQSDLDTQSPLVQTCKGSND